MLKRRAGLQTYKPLRAKKPLNCMSSRKIHQVNSEVEDRIELCRLAKGKPKLTIYRRKQNDGTILELHTVECHNGICKDCGQRSNLEPHEEGLRSRGAKVSMEDSEMLCRECHNDRGSNPQWTKKEE
ncbi:hypothetical protein LCGC14_1191470 [marine sediment metagenome]|uniref:HNH domain-containing protein n=1 Tax=marine sediment metagenome TaxID=412755 RepID=A0A0F9LJA9_9ZZZZ